MQPLKTNCETQLQIRTVDCVVVKPDRSNEVIPGSLCSDSGLAAPIAVQECGLGDCPKWQAGQWQTCKEAKCLAKNTGFRFMFSNRQTLKYEMLTRVKQKKIYIELKHKLIIKNWYDNLKIIKTCKLFLFNLQYWNLHCYFQIVQKSSSYPFQPILMESFKEVQYHGLKKIKYTRYFFLK